MSLSEESHYILVLDKNSIEQEEFKTASEKQDIFLELNIIDDYKEVSQEISQKLQLSERTEKLNLLLEGCKNIDTESYINIAKILQKGSQSLNKLSIEVGFENNFAEESFQILSEEISKFTQLTDFQFILRANNEFSQQSAAYFSQILDKQSNLTNFTLYIEDGNQFNGASLQIISQSLKSLKKLVNFQIIIGDYQKIGQQGCQEFGSALSQLTQLQKLQLQIGNNCEFNDFTNLGQSLANLQNLNTFSFNLGRKNNKNPGNLAQFGEGLKQLSSLKSLTIKIEDTNKLNSQDSEIISQGISKQTQLENLIFYIGHLNEIGQKGGIALGSALSQNKNIKDLQIFIGSLNQFGDEGFNLLSQSISQQTNLQKLAIEIGSENQINTEGLRQLGIQTQKLENLQKIYVKIEDRNEIEISSALVCFSSWANIKSVETVHFQIQEIFSMILNNKNQYLDLQFLQFVSQVEYPTILEGFNNQQQLKTLKILLDKEAQLSSEFIVILSEIFQKQQNLQSSRVKSTSSGNSNVSQQMGLFYNMLKQKNIQKAEVDVVDCSKAQIDNQPSKKRGQKLILSVNAFNNCGEQGCKSMAEIIEFVKKSVKQMTIQIGTENKLNNQCGRILCQNVLACQYLTQINFDIHGKQDQHDLNQKFQKMKTIINKCVTDRERIVNTYLRFFSKALSDYPKQQRGSLLKHICGILPLMKEFNIGNQQNVNQFGGGFGINNQFGQANMFHPDLEMEEEFFDEDEMFG